MSVLDARSLSLVFDRLRAAQHNESATEPGLTRQWPDRACFLRLLTATASRRGGTVRARSCQMGAGPSGAFGGLGRAGSAFVTASSARPDANGEAEQGHVGLSPQRNFGHTSVVARSVVQLKTGRRHTLSNKGMKLTKPEHIGASQLIPGVRQTRAGRDARMRQAA